MPDPGVGLLEGTTPLFRPWLAVRRLHLECGNDQPGFPRDVPIEWGSPSFEEAPLVGGMTMYYDNVL